MLHKSHLDTQNPYLGLVDENRVVDGLCKEKLTFWAIFDVFVTKFDRFFVISKPHLEPYKSHLESFIENRVV